MTHERILIRIDYRLVETPARITRNTQANIRNFLVKSTLAKLATGKNKKQKR